MGNHELITLTINAALRIQNVQLTSRWKMPADPFCAASDDRTTDRSYERVHSRATKARDGVEGTDLSGANRPVESADRG